MKTLILLTAIPGAGKSTWAQKYIKEHPNSFIVSSDEIRKELGGTYQYFKEEEKVWNLFLLRTNEYAMKNEDITVILDSTTPNDAFRSFYLKSTPIYNRHILVFFDCPYEIALKRNFERDEDKVVPLPVMEKIKQTFERPSKNVIDLFDEFITIV